MGLWIYPAGLLKSDTHTHTQRVKFCLIFNQFLMVLNGMYTCLYLCLQQKAIHVLWIFKLYPLKKRLSSRKSDSCQIAMWFILLQVSFEACIEVSWINLMHILVQLSSPYHEWKSFISISILNLCEINSQVVRISTILSHEDISKMYFIYFIASLCNFLAFHSAFHTQILRWSINPPKQSFKP